MLERDKRKLDGFIQTFKNRFNRYQNYYKVLGVDPDNVTDLEVKDAYDTLCYQLNKMIDKTEEAEINKIVRKYGDEFQAREVREYIHEAFEELRGSCIEKFEDAYIALRSEHSRNNYKKLLEDMERKER